MKKKVLLIVILIVSTGLLGEKTIDEKIKDLERKLQMVSGKEKIKILNSLSNELRSQSPKKSIVYARQALELSKNLNDRKSEAGAFNNIGNINRILGNFDKALESCKKSLSIYKELKDEKGMASVFLNTGNIHFRMLDYKMALNNYLEALELYEKIGDKRKIAFSLDNIGVIYSKLMNYDKSLEFSQRALKILKEVGDKRSAAITLDNIGDVYMQLKKYKMSLDYRMRSLKIEEEFGNKWGIASSANNIGVLYFLIKNYKKSLHYYMKSFQIVEEQGVKWAMASSMSNVGRVYIKLKKFNEARSYLERGLKIAKDIESKRVIQDNYEYSSELYEAKGDFQKALEYFKLYFDIYKSIFSEESNKKVAEMQTKYDTLKKEKEIVILKKDNRTQRIQRNAFIVGFILVFIILVLLFKRYLYLFAFWKKQKYIGQFRLVEEIGFGGMGTIFKAHNIRDKTDTVAIKVLRKELFADETSRERFKQEATIIDKLEHPNIIKVIERGEFQEKLYIVMEYLMGKPLDEKIAGNGGLDFNDCFHIMLQVADTLAFIHSRNIIHRDLKPSNIMLIEREGDPNFVKLLDFGLAKMKYQTKLTKTGILMGTIEYMAPEQLLRSEFSPASDVYSLGVTFYELLTGEKVFPGETAEKVTMDILNKTPVELHHLRPEISSELNQLIVNMLQKSPTQRPSSADVLNILKCNVANNSSIEG